MQEKQTFGNWHVRVADSLLFREPVLSKHWSYDYGVVWNGMAALYELTGNEKYDQYIKTGVDSFLSSDGREIRGHILEEYNLDHLNNGKQLLYLFEKTGEEKYENAIQRLLHQIAHQPRTKEGGFWHKQIYPRQMWLDGLYMCAPFYAGAARLYSRDDWFDDVAKQFLLIREKTRDEKTNLCRHAWDSGCVQPWADPATGRSKHVWGRAVGWYMCALVDALDFFPQEHPGRPKLTALLAEMANAVWKARDPRTKVWFQVLDAPDRPGNYPESSCSSQCIYALAKASRLGLLPGFNRAELSDAYQGAVEQFIQVLNGQAIVTKCCQVAGLGGAQKRDGSFAYYMSEPIIAGDLKGTGAFIQAAAEVEGYGL